MEGCARSPQRSIYSSGVTKDWRVSDQLKKAPEESNEQNRWPAMFRTGRISENCSKRYQLFDSCTSQQAQTQRQSHQPSSFKQSIQSKPQPLCQVQGKHANRARVSSVVNLKACGNAVQAVRPSDKVTGNKDKQNVQMGSRAALKIKFRKVEEPAYQNPKQNEPITNDSMARQQENHQFVQSVRRKNNQHLTKMFKESQEDFRRLLESNEQAPQWKLGQSTVDHSPQDSFRFSFFNEFVAAIDEKQEAISQCLKKRMPRAGSTLTSCILDRNECKRVMEWSRETDRTLFSAQQIDGVLKKLNHFRMLSSKIRLQTYSISDVVTFESGECIINRDAPAHYLYVVLKGSVTKLTDENLGGMVKQLSNSMFDGELFGYLDSFTGEGVYSYSVVAEEDCLLMRLPYRQYVSIQSEFLNNELATKVTFLNRLQCFNHIALKDLIPLATLLKQRRVPSGEYVVKEGQSVQQFMILTKGVATVMKSSVITRNIEKRKNYFAKTSFQPFSNSKKKSFHQPVEYKPPTVFKELDDNKIRCNYQLLASDEKQYAYFYLYDFRQLMPGECLAYRAVNRANLRDSGPQRFRLSVLSSSNDCSLLVLRTEEVCKIPDYLLYPLVRFCEQQRDFDEVCSESIKREMQQQEQFKVKLLSQIRKEHRNSRKFSYRSV